jgi:hypothetical protein
VEVRYANAYPYQTLIFVSAGKAYTVGARLALPLTQKERELLVAEKTAEHRREEKRPSWYPALSPLF